MKRLILVLVMLAMVTMIANASPPPARTPYPAGWGQPCDWGPDYSSPWGPIQVIYPGYSTYCHYPLEPVDWPEVTVNLWIETNFTVYYDWTQVNIHRACTGAGPEIIDLVLYGYINQNCNTQLQIQQWPTYPLNQMKLIESAPMAAGSDPIEVAWSYSQVAAVGPWTAMTNYLMPVSGICHHDFWLKISLNLIQCQQGGHYQYMATLCPVEGT